jgi:hypothetical protein
MLTDASVGHMNHIEYVSAATISRRWKKQIIVLILICCISGAILFGARPAAAGAPAANCKTPFAFPDAAVNFVVLPYTDSISPHKPLSNTAARLSLLVQMSTIFSILKYGSVGTVRLVVNPGEEAACQPKIVAAKLLNESPGAEATIRPGHALILFWGRLYEENSEIYLQSFAQFMRKGMDEDLSFQLWGTHYTGKLSTQAVAFAPQHLTVQDLREIESEFRQIAMVHEEPKDDSPGLPMPVEPNGYGNHPFSYRVLSVQNDWMQIEAMGLGPSGWVHPGGGLQWTRREKMPELEFVDGVTGYLRYRSAVEGDAPDSGLKAVFWAEDAFQRYEKAGDASAAPLALAVAKTLHGFLEILGPLQAPSKTKTALQLFQAASDLVPYSGDARDLDLITQWYLAYKGGAPGLKVPAVTDGLAQAAVLAPDNRNILVNLEECYQLLIDRGPPPDSDLGIAWDSGELQKKLDAVRIVRAASP